MVKIEDGLYVFPKDVSALKKTDYPFKGNGTIIYLIGGEYIVARVELEKVREILFGLEE